MYTYLERGQVIQHQRQLQRFPVSPEEQEQKHVVRKEKNLEPEDSELRVREERAQSLRVLATLFPDKYASLASLPPPTYSLLPPSSFLFLPSIFFLLFSSFLLLLSSLQPHILF